MVTWRYIAHFSGQEVDSITRPYNYMLESEEQGLAGLEDFLHSRRDEFGDRLLSVALQKSEADREWDDYLVNWEDVKRINP